MNVSNIDSRLHKSKENDIISSDNEFWEPSGRRIFKGERTKIKYFPFMATIQIFNNFQCAGSIIKSDLIITAASCLQLAWNNRFFRENPAFLSVRVGSSFYNGGGEVIPILEIYFYPGYNPKTLKDNLCLLRLTRHLKFRRRQKNIKKIDFDRNEFKLPLNTPGITVVGWGAKEHSSIIGNPWKNKLSEAVLDFYPLRECQEVYSRQYVTKNNFCAGFFSRGGGACNRDVGGPGILYGKLLGVISFGSPVCGMPDAPTVFTKLGYYSDWIEDIMEQYVPVSKKRTTLKPTHDPHIGPIRYIPPKPTTFKIPPITGKIMTPIPISQIDSQLRIIDENVFKDFLATMFNSKEIKEYKDILKDDENVLKDYVAYDKDIVETVADTIYSVTESQNIVEPHTLVLDGSVDSESVKNNIDTAYTVMGLEKNPYKDDFSEEVSKIIDNVDLEKIVKEEVMVPLKKEKSPKSKSDYEIKGAKNVVVSDDEKNINCRVV
ncbi:plasma kallikrein-like [Vanessa atalanta]|uniref:plasma kallikrein-like n=1 Tax=Vanessa atalanta TaxID=42275 RepID=UPI001FCDE73A|nr:plasma kallikrein-like [Vanessa atalanta]